MASVTFRKGSWYVRFKDATGHWTQQVCSARTKTEAKRLAGELEQKAERQRRGLETLPGDPSLTLGKLVEWWHETYPSVPRTQRVRFSFLRHHILGTKMAQLPLAQVASGTIEVFLQSKVNDLAPRSVNHLRSYLCSAFSAGRRAGKWTGVNPVNDVQRRKVHKRLPEYLTVEEVPRVLAALDARWRPLFATAIFTGLRKGELFGLRKVDVDLERHLLAVCYSHERDTTKGGRAEVVPIAPQLVPFLKEALEHSPSELVFPDAKGERLAPDLALQDVLRRALGRADIVTGYQLSCRRKGCGYREKAATNEVRRCPTCNMKLWPRGIVRPIRFHALRHTTASLLMMAGANPAAVQRIMRHTDPRLTTEVYGHLSPDYLRGEAQRLNFQGLASEADASPEALPPGSSSTKKPSIQDRPGTWLTIQQAATRLSLSTATIYKMVDKGQVQHLRVGNSIRIHDEDLKALRLHRSGKHVPESPV